MTGEGGAGPAADRQRVEDALERLLDGAGASAIARAAGYAVRGGGKRLRPVLCVAAYRAVAGTVPAPVYDLACSLELIHTYSLVHDDLPSMDDDPVRRGRPATHVAEGVGPATVAGAALIPMAARTAADAARRLGLDDDGVAEVARTLAVAAGAGGMVGGQALDLEAEGRATTAAELERIHRSKTGALLTAAVRIGGIAAGAGPAVLEGLSGYGRALGLAFQIADDILDVTGSPAVLGKAAGRDVALAKATYPALIGLEAARVRAREESDAARAALRAVGLHAPELEAMARYAVERDR